MLTLLILLVTIFSQINICAMEITEDDCSTEEEDNQPPKRQKLTHKQQVACIVEGCGEHFAAIQTCRRHLIREHTVNDSKKIWDAKFHTLLVKNFGDYSRYQTSEIDVFDGFSKCNHCEYYFFKNNKDAFKDHLPSCNESKGKRCSIAACNNKRFPSISSHYANAHKKNLKDSVVGKESIPSHVAGFAKYHNTITDLETKFLYKCENCRSVFMGDSHLPRHTQQCAARTRLLEEAVWRDCSSK